MERYGDRAERVTGHCVLSLRGGRWAMAEEEMAVVRVGCASCVCDVCVAYVSRACACARKVVSCARAAWGGGLNVGGKRLTYRAGER
jgi:hypothetical protein